MIEELQQFGNFSMAQRTGGAPVELMRSKDEDVFLAFDNRIRRLVELHVLRGGSTLDVALKRSAFDRARQASGIRGHSFMRILEVGEDQGLVYYTSNLNDGEFIDDYIKRRGALAPATALAMVYQLLDDLLQLKGCQRLVSGMHLDRVLVTTLEDTFLQLRIFDYGLSQMDGGEEAAGHARLVVEVCRLIFRLLTGQADSEGHPDRFPALTQLPMNLRITVRTALTVPANAPTSIEKLRDDVREAFSALVSSIQARNLRKQLVVNAALLPQSHLQELLLENVPVETIMGTRFRIEDADHTRRYPFSIPAVNAKVEQSVTVHLLPPSRIVEKTRYEAVPLQMWRFNPERHPNILRSLSLWESPDWTFLTEEREPGFALSRLMAERLTLNPAEVLTLMRQIRAGLDQAVECGVQRVDLHPSNILLRVGKNGPLLAREFERLMQKRLDTWPAFVVKLRPHMTMRSLYEPLLVDTDIAETPQEEHLLDRDFRHRSFATLAAYLLTGERLGGGAPQFAESVPEAVAAYMGECMELTRRAGKSPSPGDFIENFERLLSGPTVDRATRLRGSSVAIEEMESVGSVSDFDEDWSRHGAEEKPFEDTVLSPAKRAMKTHHFTPLNPEKRSFPWAALAAAAGVVVGMGAWVLIPGEKPVETVFSSVQETSLTPALTKSAAAERSPSPQMMAEKKVEKAEVKQSVAPTVPAKPVLVAVKTPVMKSQPPDTLLPAETRAADTPAVIAVVPAPQAVVVADKPADVTFDKTSANALLPLKVPVTIRRAIIPTQEEIARMRQGHVENRTGRLSAMSTASPMPPQNKFNP